MGRTELEGQGRARAATDWGLGVCFWWSRSAGRGSEGELRKTVWRRLERRADRAERNGRGRFDDWWQW